MVNKEYDANEVFEMLKTKIRFINENSEEYIFRCPYCGDSKNPNHGHLYVSKYSPVFHCKRCNAGVGQNINDLLRHLELPTVVLPDKDDMVIDRTKISIENYTKSDSLILRNFYKESPIIDWFRYIKKRLGLSKDDIAPYIQSFGILNPYLIDDLDFKNVNYQLSKKIKELIIEGAAVPFLTFRNKLMITRLSRKQAIIEAGLRYYSIVLSNDIKHDDLFLTADFDEIDFNSIDTLIVSEGIFDSLGLFFHLKDQFDLEKTIWVSVLSNSYLRAIKFVDSVFNILPNSLTVKVFLDNDVAVERNMYQFSKALRSRNNDVLVKGDVDLFINAINKDYGVEDIQLQKIASV